MDDEAVFGKPLFVLNFGEAIRRGLLTDYQVVIIGVDSPMVASWIDSRELVKTESGIENDAESLASQVGLLKAMKDYDLRRMISFHSRVSRAESFAEDLKHVIGWVDPKQRPSGEFKTDYVSGEMPTDKRRRKLSQLKNIGINERGLLTNARCLSEGVDVPSLDGVAFIDPRGSQVDIIQAVGRAIRLSPNKQKGTIVLPVFIENNANPEVSIEASRFKPIWDILNALKAHDDVLSEELDQMRSALGKRKGSSRDQGGFSKIEIDLPASIDKSFSESIRTHLIESVTDSWEFWYGLLLEYREEHGDYLVPGPYETQGHYKLGSWVAVQRKLKDSMPESRRRRLNDLDGWIWDPHAVNWERGFLELVKYSETNGHSQPPVNFITKEGFPLGGWTYTQRRGRGDSDTSRIARLESLKGWSWSPKDRAWENAYNELCIYVQEHGDCLVPKKYEASSGFKLGQWLINQRRLKESMQDERARLLTALNGWSWDVADTKWNSNFELLKEYSKNNGTSLVPSTFKSKDGLGLGMWVSKQRRDKSKLSNSQIDLLEALPNWTWNFAEAKWGIGFDYLQKYVNETGSAKVVQTFCNSDGFALGTWVVSQRKAKDSLTDEKRKKLESLKGWTWGVLDSMWQKGFEYLCEYVEKNGSALVPKKEVVDQNFKLGDWVLTQRRTKSKLSEDKIKKLEALEAWTWDPLADQWNVAFEELKKFIEQNNSSSVPVRFKTKSGFTLGGWVYNQRKNKTKLSLEQLQKLNSLNHWSW